jgi:hypothetical protein
VSIGQEALVAGKEALPAMLAREHIDAMLMLTLNWVKQCIILCEAIAGTIKKENKMWENVKLRKLKSEFHCISVLCLMVMKGYYFPFDL